MTTFVAHCLVALALLMLVHESVGSQGYRGSKRQKLMLRQWLNKRTPSNTHETGESHETHETHESHESHESSSEIIDNELISEVVDAILPDAETSEESEANAGHPHGPTCNPELFTCNNGECSLMSWRCDGDSDCDDGSDEIDCPPVTCRPGFFMCGNNRCVPSSVMCDTDDDCGDGSDETTELCENFVRTCPPGYWQCESNSRCIRESWLCDGDNDCGDYSDERNCNRTCSPGSFQCPNGRCIPGSYVCDGDNDCGDLADEQNCGGGGGPTCSSSQFQCHNNNRCIPQAYVCDGDNDCGDLSDEQNCGSGGGGTSRPPQNCPDEFFPLRSGSPSCYHPVTAGLQWQAAADYCRAVHPTAHLLVVDTSSEYQAFVEIMGHTPDFIAESCPYWWTAGRRVDDSSLQAPFVWRTFGQFCPADGCLDEVQIDAWWEGSGALNVPEGQPACIMYRGVSSLPWTSAPCSSHACAFCELSP